MRILVLIFTLASCLAGEETYDLGYKPHLFIDDWLIARRANVWQRIQQPSRHPANPVLVPEYPWEASRAHIGTVLWDPLQQKFRMWYSAFGLNWRPSGMAYAESADGIHWLKPLMKILPLPGHDRTNLVSPVGGNVFLDPHASDPKQRYKCLFPKPHPQKGHGDQIWAIFSEDGLHWGPPGGQLVVAESGMRDHGFGVLWSDRLEKYLLFTRGHMPRDTYPFRPVPWGVRIRTEDYQESRDFVNWSAAETLFQLDARDGSPWAQTYDPCVIPYGDAFLMFETMLHVQDVNVYAPEKPYFKEFGYLDVQLLLSRDGRKWSRVANRETFIPVGPAGAWDDQEVRMAPWCVLIRDNTVYVYYGGMSNPHATGSPGSIGLATLPVDRFVSFHPLYAESQRKTGTKEDAGLKNLEGILETRLVQWPSGRLLVNATVAESGVLQVEALDAAGSVVEGFGAKECALRRYDDLRYEVRWGGKTLNALRAQNTEGRLRFRMSGQVHLFAFQVARMEGGW